MATADDLDTLITQFLRDAEDGRARGDLRELRGALAHIGSELGTLPVDAVRPLDVQRVIERLRRAGLPPARLRSIVEALRSLYAYAIGRGLVRTSPVVGVTPPGDEDSAHTPTEAVLALAGSAVSLLARTAVVAFVLIVAALVVALI